MLDSATQADTPVAPRPHRWRRRLQWAAIAAAAVLGVALFIVKDYVRTLRSLRRVPGTNAFVMDYYADYHLDQIRAHGMDVDHIEDACMRTLFPDFVMPIASRVKRWFLPQPINTLDAGTLGDGTLGNRGEHCSTVALRSSDGTVFLGHNLDNDNDVYLILRVHDSKGVASLAVIDLAYLNQNRADLDETSLLARIPLLFAPYYVMDGMNRQGVAVSVMSVPDTAAPSTPGKPAIIQPTLMRVLLDYAHDADEAVALIREFNVQFVAAPLHVVVADAAGQFRVVEYLDGEIRVTIPSEPWQVCTNHNVWHLTEAENDAADGRYLVGSETAERLHGEVDAAAARRVTQSMSRPGVTMWTSIFDLTHGEASIAYKSNFETAYSDVIPLAVAAP